MKTICINVIISNHPKISHHKIDIYLLEMKCYIYYKKGLPRKLLPTEDTVYLRTIHVYSAVKNC